MDALLQDAIRQMNISLRNMKFYAPEHPTATASVQRAYDAVMQMVKEKGGLTLGVVENTLIVDESPVEESDTFITNFTEELNIRNIESLVFYPGLSQDEFRAFVNCLTCDPDRVMADGGAQKLFESEGVLHVRANEVKYGKIKESSGDGAGLEEAIVAAFLMGKMPSVEGDRKGFVSLLVDNPAKIGEIINTRFAQMREKGEGEDQPERAVNRAMEQVGRFLETEPGGSEKYGNVMTQIIFSLNPEVQAGLYGFRATQEDYPQDRMDSFVMEFTDEEAIRLIGNVYQGGLGSREMLARVVTRVSPSVERRVRIAPDLGRELMKLGMGKEAWERLRDDILWDAYSLTQKVDRLTRRGEVTKSDIDRIRQLGPDLAEKKKGEETHRLLKSLLAALGGDDAEVRAIAAAYLSEFHRVIEDSGRFKGVELFFYQKLIARLGREPEESVRESLLVSLGVILKKEILKGHLNAAARAVLTLTKTGYLLRLIELSDTLVSQDLTEHVITALSSDDKNRRNEASVLLKLFGRAVLQSVLFVLEREENPDTRKQLMVIVKSMGTEITGEIVNRLADTRWYVVRGALYVLGEIGDSSVSPDLLTSSVYHDDIRVRKEAIKTLGKLKSRGAVKILCELLEEKDDEIRLFALKSLGEAGDKMAVPHLLLFLQKKKLKGEKSELLRQTAIKDLARIGDPEAIPALLDLLRSKGFFKRVDEAVRKSVVEALGAFRVPDLEEVLQTVIEKDTDLGVREAARRALLQLRSPEKKTALQARPL